MMSSIVLGLLGAALVVTLVIVPVEHFHYKKTWRGAFTIASVVLGITAIVFALAALIVAVGSPLGWFA